MLRVVNMYSKTDIISHGIKRLSYAFVTGIFKMFFDNFFYDNMNKFIILCCWSINNDIIGAKEKQAAPKATFVFHAPLTSKQTAKQAEERFRRGLASLYDIIGAKEKTNLATYYGFIDDGRIVKEISATELEAACRKCVSVEVTSAKALARVLDGMGVDYKVLDDRRADIYAKMNISQLTFALAKENCEVLSVKEHDESLESFFLSLVGGDRHE